MKGRIVATLFAAAFGATVAEAGMFDYVEKPDGRHFHGVSTATGKSMRGFNAEYFCWLPAGMPTNNLALYLQFEASIRQKCGKEITEMMRTGQIPPGMFLHVTWGYLGPTRKDGSPRGLRATIYDQIGTDFPNFIVDELIPMAAHFMRVTIDPNPERHVVMGGSSPGIASWNMAWHRNDYFRRVYMASPTFSAIRGGDEVLPIVRKCEPRPIKIFMVSGTVEPEYYFGDSFVAALNAALTFQRAGYDFKYEMYEHEGHCANLSNPAVVTRSLPWLFAGWKTNAVVTVPGCTPRVKELVVPGSPWRECNFLMPPAKREVVSTDGWRNYYVSPTNRFVMAQSLPNEKGQQHRMPLILAPLHIAWNAKYVGGYALALLDNDRVLVATDLGIQGVVSFGITDLILPLPEDLPADNVAVVGKTLYASSGGRVFAREITHAAADPTKIVAPKTPEYGDPGLYKSIEHLPIPWLVPAKK